MDLNLIINESLSKLKEEGFLEKVVKSHLEKTIESVINDTLRSYSDFGKSLSKQVEELLQINLKNLDIPSYNQLILATIKDHLNAVVHDQGVSRMKEQLDKLLLTSKDDYKLSELIKELAEEVDDLGDLGYEETHEMTLIIDREWSWLIRIYFDSESNKEKYDCKYNINVDAKTGQVDTVRIRDDSYRSKKDFKEFDTRAIMGGFYGLEETLFKIYARKANLIIDEKDCELELSNPEYN
ncbi:hypothetical protein [Brevibacillus sp. NRS-1366]|uniref:hypothetical protein n=1 Tax=Brevibacillus sp. NRS-1366 TaxID=3233899 RepID=UPI003D25F21F